MDFIYLYIRLKGGLVHEAMAAILAYRISRIMPITFSFAMNDYGFELLSDQPIPVDDTNVYELFSPEDLMKDIQERQSARNGKTKIPGCCGYWRFDLPGIPGRTEKTKTSASIGFSFVQGILLNMNQTIY